MSDKTLDDFLKLWTKKEIYGFVKDREKIIAEKDRIIKEISEAYSKQHELLDQYELNCTDEIIRLKNQSIAELKEENKKINRALELAVKDKAELENALLENLLDGKKAVSACPRLPQYYIEKAEEEMRNKDE